MAGSFMRRATKLAALPLGTFTRRRAGDVVCLLYHRVGPGDGEIEIDLSTFRSHLHHLAAQNHVLDLDRAWAEPSGGVVITFDDGFADFHERVVPCLVETGVYATLYLATSFVEAPPTNGAEPLTWAQLRDAVGTGLVTIGSHTHSHADLSRASEPEAEAEMRRSKDLIEDKLGTACNHFAFPWAVASAPALRAAQKLFDSVALDAWKTNRKGRTDPKRFGRTPVLRSDGQRFFVAKVDGRLDAEAWFYRASRRGPWAKR